MRTKENEKQRKNVVLEQLLQHLTKQERGITLIALVVTIVVLLVLAGVSINLVLGNNGLITKSKEAKTATVHSQVYDAMQLEAQSYFIEKIEGSYTGTLTGYLNRNASKPIINNDGIINVANLLGSTLSLGNGTSIDGGDVYVLEQRQITASTTTENLTLDYYLVYYDKNNNETVLGKISKNEQEAEKTPSEIYYGDASIQPSPTDLFKFTLDEENGTASISLNGSLVDTTDVNHYYKLIFNGEEVKNIVIPYEYIDNSGKHYTVEKFKSLYGCDNITSIILPSTVQEIGRYYDGFAYCSGITELVIPESVTTIAEGSFQGCNNLTDIYCKKTNKPSGWADNWLGDCGATVHWGE